MAGRKKLTGISDNLDNVFNAINKRLQELNKTFGRDTAAYNDYESIIRKNFEFRQTKNGTIQLKRGKANSNLNRFQRQALEHLVKGGQTVGSMKAAAKQALQKEGADITKQAIEEMAIKQDYVKAHRDIISRISEQINEGMEMPDSLKDLYNRAAGRSDELTYSELYDLMVNAASDAEFIGIW